MTVSLIKRGATAELLLDGRLDSVTAPEVENIFSATAERYDNVILNMEKMEYISSAGLRILRTLHMTVKKKGGELTLTHVNKLVMEVFEMTGFVTLFRFG